MRALILFLLLVPVMALSQVYRQTAPDGTVSYTDKPSARSERIKLKPIQTYQPAKSAPATDKAGDSLVDKLKKPVSYKEVRLVSPGSSENIWSAPGIVEAVADAAPPLAPGHKYAFFLDGRQVGKPIEHRQLTIKNVFRGRHTLQVKIVDEKGSSLKESDTVIFHVHRPNINSRPLSQAKPKPLLPKITALPIIKNVIKAVKS